MKKFLAILFLSLFLLSSGAVLVSAAKISGTGGVCCETGDCNGDLKLECKCLPASSNGCELKKDSDGNILGVKKGIAGICGPKGEEVLCPFSTNTTIEGFIKTITDWIFYLALIICPLLIIVGAFFFLTSGGEPKKTSSGKALIKWAAIGLVIILLSKALFSAMTNIITGA